MWRSHAASVSSSGRPLDLVLVMGWLRERLPDDAIVTSVSSDARKWTLFDSSILELNHNLRQRRGFEAALGLESLRQHFERKVLIGECRKGRCPNPTYGLPRVTGTCVYKPHLFDSRVIDRFLRDFRAVLEQMVRQPDRSISTIRVPPRKKRQIRDLMSEVA